MLIKKIDKKLENLNKKLKSKQSYIDYMDRMKEIVKRDKKMENYDISYDYHGLHENYQSRYKKILKFQI